MAAQLAAARVVVPVTVSSPDVDGEHAPHILDVVLVLDYPDAHGALAIATFLQESADVDAVQRALAPVLAALSHEIVAGPALADNRILDGDIAWAGAHARALLEEEVEVVDLPPTAAPTLEVTSWLPRAPWDVYEVKLHIPYDEARFAALYAMGAVMVKAIHPGTHVAGADACAYCHRPADLRCDRCHATRYCCEACRQADWPNHESACTDDVVAALRRLEIEPRRR